MEINTDGTMVMVFMSDHARWAFIFKTSVLLCHLLVNIYVTIIGSLGLIHRFDLLLVKWKSVTNFLAHKQNLIQKLCYRCCTKCLCLSPFVLFDENSCNISFCFRWLKKTEVCLMSQLFIVWMPKFCKFWQNITNFRSLSYHKLCILLMESIRIILLCQ
jgi:hypothetical protein